jgi:hypothetical protein
MEQKLGSMPLPDVNPGDYGLPASEGTRTVLSGGQSLFARAGLYTPLARGVTTAAVVGSGLYLLQPEFAFDQYGPKSWSLLYENTDEAPTTHLPWWLVAVGAGVLAAEFL